MRLLGGSMAEAQSLKNSQSSLDDLNRNLTCGTKYRLFFPMAPNIHGDMDIITASQPGRSLDAKKMRSVFVAIDDFDQTSTGKIIDNSGLGSLARISKVLFDAGCKAEKAKAKTQAQMEADTIGEELDATALNQKLKEIEVEYYGDMDARPNKILPSKNPLIGGLKVYAVTEVLVVPMTSDDKPDWSKKWYASVELKNRKVAQLSSLIADKNYYDGTSSFLEVSYDYGRGTTDKKIAGQNATFNGVSKDMSFANQFPDIWEANKGDLDNLAKTAEAVGARNKSISMSRTVKEIVETFKKVVSQDKLALGNIDYEADITKAAAQDFIDLELVKSIPKVQEKLLALLEAQKEEKKEKETETTVDAEMDQREFDAVASATSLAELAEASNDLDSITGGDDETGAGSDIDNI